MLRVAHYYLHWQPQRLGVAPRPCFKIGLRQASSTPEHSFPRFCVNSHAVMPLLTPTEFYQQLLHGCARAKRRITLASLYMGTGPLEQRLASTILKRCLEVPDLEIAIQLDLSRALRVVPPLPNDAPHLAFNSSAQLLLWLLRHSQQQHETGNKRANHSVPDDVATTIAPKPGVHVGLSLMPQLRTWLGRLLPPR